MGKKISIIIALLTLCICIAVFCVIKLISFPKIGVIDNTSLLANFSETIAANKKFMEEKSRWDCNIKILEDSVKTAVDLMAKEYNNASKQKREKMQQNLQRWNTEYSRYIKAVQQLSITKEQELMTPVAEKVNSFVKNWADEHGYDIIYGTGKGGVILSVNPKLNITSRVLKDMNKLYGLDKSNFNKEANKMNKNIPENKKSEILEKKNKNNMREKLNNNEKELEKQKTEL